MGLMQVKIQGLDFSYDDELLASCGGQDDCKLVIWRTKTGKRLSEKISLGCSRIFLNNHWVVKLSEGQTNY
jgi:WD40 repeat protein